MPRLNGVRRGMKHHDNMPSKEGIEDFRLATRIATKIAAYTYAFLINRVLGRPQGHIKELWA
jgi:hypothetical protein